jgi:hypothetical protein
MQIAKELSETLSLAEATEYLNAPRSQMDVLVGHAFIQPPRRVMPFGAQQRYAVADLDAFLARLRRKISRVGQKRLANIPDAARSACCAAAEVVQLILDGRLRTASGQPAGYLGILVDPRDVAKAVTGTQERRCPAAQSRRAARHPRRRGRLPDRRRAPRKLPRCQFGQPLSADAGGAPGDQEVQGDLRLAARAGQGAENLHRHHEEQAGCRRDHACVRSEGGRCEVLSWSDCEINPPTRSPINGRLLTG